MGKRDVGGGGGDGLLLSMLKCGADCLKPGVEDDFQAAGRCSSEPIHLAGVSHSMAVFAFFQELLTTFLC